MTANDLLSILIYKPPSASHLNLLLAPHTSRWPRTGPRLVLEKFQSPVTTVGDPSQELRVRASGSPAIGPEVSHKPAPAPPGQRQGLSCLLPTAPLALKLSPVQRPPDIYGGGRGGLPLFTEDVKAQKSWDQPMDTWLLSMGPGMVFWTPELSS